MSIKKSFTKIISSITVNERSTKEMINYVRLNKNPKSIIITALIVRKKHNTEGNGRNLSSF